MKNLDNFRPMNASQVEDLIVKLWHIFITTGQRYTLYIEGPPGGGKTSIFHAAARRIAAAMDRVLSDTARPGEGELGSRVIHFGNISEEVFAGLPWVDKSTSTLQRAIDVMWPREGMGIALFDEPFQVGYPQRFVSQLMSEGKFGDYYALPGQWMFVLCGNSTADRAGTQRIWTHVQNRLIHVRLTTDVGTVLSHFRDPATPEVSVFLRWFDDKLHDFNLKGGPFASPRTWDYVNSLMAQGIDPVDDFPVLQGLLGTDVATDFKVTFDAISALPDIDAMLSEPDSYSETMRAMGSNNPASVCALASVLLRRYTRDRDTALAGTGVKLMAYSSAEHAAFYVACAEQVDRQANDGKSVLDTPEYTRYMAENSHLTAN